jgi:hypothetical protein
MVFTMFGSLGLLKKKSRSYRDLLFLSVFFSFLDNQAEHNTGIKIFGFYYVCLYHICWVSRKVEALIYVVLFSNFFFSMRFIC